MVCILAYSEVPLAQLGKDVSDGALVGVEFHLARTVEQEVAVTVLLQFLLQPVQVGLNILHAVQ